MNKIILSKISNYFNIYTLILIILLFSFGSVSTYIGAFQLFSIFLLWLFFTNNLYSIKLSQVITSIVIFHVIMLSAMLLLPDDLVPFDGKTYDWFGIKGVERGIFSSLARMFTSSFGPLNISDLGYCIPVGLSYFIFGESLGYALLWILKLVVHVYTCILLYKFIIRWFDKHGALLVTLIFGLNTFLDYFIVGNLKENLFCYAVLLATYYLYEALYTKTLYNKLKFIFFVFVTYLFRGSFPSYFLFAYFGAILIRKCPKKYLELSLIAFVLITFMAESFVGFVNDDYLGAVKERDEIYQGNNIIINYLGPFMSPFPALSQANQLVNRVTIAFSLLNISFAYFAIMGMWHVIKSHNSKYYALLYIFLLNAVMLNLTGFSINARYTYPLICIYYIFIPLGLKHYFKPKYYVPYMILAFAITYLYNVR